GDDVVAVDTGIAGKASVAAWEALLAGPISGRRIGRVVCTHFHPDHGGLAGWLCRRFDAPLVMTQAESLMLRLLAADARDTVPDEATAFWRAAGWDEAQVAAASVGGWGRFARLVSPPPLGFRRIADGDAIAIGGRDWRVVTGNGHSPEHACLLDEERGLLIAGDQVLPRISSNVSLHVTEPDGDPLGDWFASLAKLRRLPADLLVLPGHGEPFLGLHPRLDALAAEHRDRLDALADRLREAPRRATDCFAALFRRPVGDDVLTLATGEALAHLRRLEREGRAVREDRDGIWWWRAV
ncbi:MAG: MBL fold metallo-hydrolase, partial [Janthinobacterium lividum]